MCTAVYVHLPAVARASVLVCVFKCVYMRLQVSVRARLVGVCVCMTVCACGHVYVCVCVSLRVRNNARQGAQQCPVIGDYEKIKNC